VIGVPPYAQQGNVVIAAESTAFAATSVPRNEPYYAFREERRNAINARVIADLFVIDRLSLGGALNVGYEHTDSLGSIATAGLQARLGYVLGGALWPGAFASVRRQGRFIASGGGDLRIVLPITKTILFTLGPRFEIDDDRERTWSLNIGLAGATRTDSVPRPVGRARFGFRGMRVLQLQVAATSLPALHASVGFDGFLWHGASIGSFVGATSNNSGAARVTALTAGARVGQAIIFSDRVWWWGRVGFQVSRADVADGVAPRTVFEATAEMPFIASVAKGVGITCGPWINVPLLKSSLRKTSIGAGSSLVLFF
jgi:hypothetical protein